MESGNRILVLTGIIAAMVVLVMVTVTVAGNCRSGCWSLFRQTCQGRGEQRESVEARGRLCIAKTCRELVEVAPEPHGDPDTAIMSHADQTVEIGDIALLLLLT